MLLALRFGSSTSALEPLLVVLFLDLETKSLSLGYCLWFFDSLLLILDPWFLSIS